MSGTYKAIGINLKSSPLGESDRLLTILTAEFGLLRVVAPGARKHKSSLAGRSSLFVVNELLLAQGKNLDKIIQAESLESYPGLSQNLSKLTAGQYLAELVLFQALSDHPQPELFRSLQVHLTHIAQLPSHATLACLTHATFDLLAIAGISPQVYACCLTQQAIAPDLDNTDWRVGFSALSGGIIHAAEFDRLRAEQRTARQLQRSPQYPSQSPLPRPIAAHPTATYPSTPHPPTPYPPPSPPVEYLTPLTALELHLLQHLPHPDFIPDLLQSEGQLFLQPAYDQIWLSIERVLRHYAQFHFERPIRSAALIDACFNANAASAPYDSV